jgi:hypothetical protein
MNQLRVTVCVLALCTSVATAFLPPTATTSTAGTTATTHGPTATTTALFDKKKQPSRAKPKGFAGALRDLQLTTFQYAGGIRPGTQSPQKKVNINTIVKPDYSEDGLVCIQFCHVLLFLFIPCIGLIGTVMTLYCHRCTGWIPHSSLFQPFSHILHVRIQ